MRPTWRSGSTLPSAPRTSSSWPGSDRPQRTKRARAALVGGSAAGWARWLQPGSHVDRVGAQARAERGEGQGQGRLGHAVAGDEGLAIEAGRRERLGEAARARRAGSCRRRCRRCASRQVQIGRRPGWRRGGRRARSRRSGCRRWCRGCARSGPATAAAGARRRAAAEVDRASGATAAPAGSRPGPCRDRAAARTRRGRRRDVEAVGPVMPCEVGHQRALGDRARRAGSACCPRRTAGSRASAGPSGRQVARLRQGVDHGLPPCSAPPGTAWPRLGA